MAAGGVAGRRCSYGDAADRQRDRANGGLRGALICFLSFSRAREAPAERAPLADWDYEVEVDVGPRRRARYGVIIIGGQFRREQSTVFILGDRLHQIARLPI